MSPGRRVGQGYSPHSGASFCGGLQPDNSEESARPAFDGPRNPSKLVRASCCQKVVPARRGRLTCFRMKIKCWAVAWLAVGRCVASSVNSSSVRFVFIVDLVRALVSLPIMVIFAVPSALNSADILMVRPAARTAGRWEQSSRMSRSSQPRMKIGRPCSASFSLPRRQSCRRWSTFGGGLRRLLARYSTSHSCCSPKKLPESLGVPLLRSTCHNRDISCGVQAAWTRAAVPAPWLRHRSTTSPRSRRLRPT